MCWVHCSAFSSQKDHYFKNLIKPHSYRNLHLLEISFFFQQVFFYHLYNNVHLNSFLPSQRRKKYHILCFRNYIKYYAFCFNLITHRLFWSANNELIMYSALLRCFILLVMKNPKGRQSSFNTISSPEQGLSLIYLFCSANRSNRQID